MANPSGIFIFTRDRPHIFGATLASVNATEKNIFVIDDSVDPAHCLSNRDITLNHGRIYLGKPEFEQFILRHQIALENYPFLLRAPGNQEWNLGYMRNFALLFAKSCPMDNALFMDDDIQVKDIGIIDLLLNLTKTYPFTGANIMGMVDDSILGHIATSLAMPSERMLSGGFMAFVPGQVTAYFLNCYNEDWIWLYLQVKSKKYLQTGEVYQKITNPTDGYRKKIIFQEFGERVLEGTMVAYEKGHYGELTTGPFWQRVIEERSQYLLDMQERADLYGCSAYSEIINFVKTNSEDLRPGVFYELFQNYVLKLKLFHELFNSFPN